MIAQDKLIHGLLSGALVGCLAGLVWIFGPSLWLELGYQFRPKEAKTVSSEPSRGSELLGEVPVSGFGSLFYSVEQGFSQLNQGAEVLIAPLSTDFGLVIPKILANVAVTGDVNPADPNFHIGFNILGRRGIKMRLKYPYIVSSVSLS